jgi:hypothetical protein
MFFRLMLLFALIATLSQNPAQAADYRSCTASEIGLKAGAAGGVTASGILATTPLCVGAVIAVGVAAGATAGHVIGSSINEYR